MKLKVLKSDAKTDLQVVALRAADRALQAIQKGTVKEDGKPRKPWREGNKLDHDTLQLLCDLISQDLKGLLHCVAGTDFSSCLRYARKSLVIIGSNSLKILLYKSVPITDSATSPVPRPVASSESVTLLRMERVKVVAPLPDDEEAVKLARIALSEDTATSVSEATSNEPTAQARANRLKEALTVERGGHWHIVFDKQPIAATVLTARVMTLQYDKHTYICYQHSSPGESLFSMPDLPTLKLIAAVVLAIGCFWYYTECYSSPTRKDNNMHMGQFIRSISASFTSPKVYRRIPAKQPPQHQHQNTKLFTKHLNATQQMVRPTLNLSCAQPHK
ncbi:hypothetical protein CYMTET_13432 [Cymbomonas tetramitiformis]|uniref:Uncharacterized protein n=1 Tax=Cymbomonas tetramitiformis TaxID=36881 RepID=A0AAE0LB30_9CHLO|nr:hypothetical protein CYMTET_13432 [Cymbomonas tetramitiformis]